MKRLAALLLLAVAAVAAPWDGGHGPLSVFTFNQPGYLPGVPGMTPGTPALTIMWLACSDSGVTAVRTRISFHDETGDHQDMVISDVLTGRGIVVTRIAQSQITSVQFTELREGNSY